MKYLLSNAHIVLDDQTEIFKGSILVENGLVKKVFSQDETLPEIEKIDLEGKTIFPGFIDLHIHGAMGYDFITGRKAVEVASDNLAKDGTTAFLASLTVLSPEQTLKTLESLAHHEESGATCLGVHMEGSYLSKEYKALMDERYLRDPSIEETAEMIKASNHTIVTMTIAPELHGMDTFIPYLVSQNIIPMIGHTAATCQEALKGLAWGAKGFTHFYNAMSQHTHRNPGCVTAGFLQTDNYKEMICDGFHTDPDVVKMTYKYLGAKQIILITDAMLGKGLNDGDYIFSGLDCHKEGIHVRVKETGRIAGSAFGMIDAFRFIKQLVKPTAPELCALSSGNAAKLLGDNKRGNLHAGSYADLVIMDNNDQILATLNHGQVIYDYRHR